MGITQQIVLEAIDKIVESKSGKTLSALPAPNEPYKYMPFRKLKRLLNKLLSRFGFFLVTYSDYENSVQNCPNTFGEWSVEFLRYLMENPEEIDWLFTRLSDDYSRRMLKWFIQYRIASSLLGEKKNTLFPPKFSSDEYKKGLQAVIKTAKEEYMGVYEVEGFNILTSKGALFETFFLNQYQYKNIVYPKAGDFVLDIGAYCGETTLWFSKSVGESGRVWAFEPESANRRILEQNIRKKDVNNVKIVEKGAFNENTQMYISSQGGSSTVVAKDVGESIDLVTIDHFVKSEGISKIDYVKMDIEGSEQMAIDGMVETIKKFSPNLALSVYHLHDDIVKIPEMVLKINPHYNVYLDHFSPNISETVMFFSDPSKN